MGTLYLVRHGQASLGASDYDQLSPLGEQQCRLLGEYWRSRGLRFDAVLCGGMKRHAQSLAAIAEGLGQAELPAVQRRPGLNEYDSEALIRSVFSGPLDRPRDAESARQYFRLLRAGLRAWMSGQTEPEGMPSYAEFSAGIAAVLTEVREQCEGQVLLVSSGGPISSAIGQLLQASCEAVIDLNLRIRNSAVSEFSFGPKRHAMLTFNTVPHLDSPQGQALITSA
ncbi:MULTISPECIES: histidine phosphatase family protein [Roseateles]|uniref:Histidine phosphatase family protein n=1 Tax=Roseateles albus TaxID=2987525 RepID=A0ABT5KHB6_9BURK|nr:MULTISPECIES: histidine phosphatase family protein [Roseateles]MCV2357400.1 histidine phosphatase family protein [Paucibacter sp. TC2R-5]MDC8772787.1 histidine phosphatase family protein [Roseateles albus]